MKEMNMERAVESKRVLVVDDNADAAFVVAELLKFRGHEVEVAFGGPEGYAAAVAMAPDVVLLDIGMPVMNGYQVAVALRSDAKTRAIRLIALTAWGDAESRARAVSSGFDRHLVKPADFESIFQAVESAAV
jgi:CheY-like chemotaxis protein